MRHIGTLDKASAANRFAAYLVTEGVDAHAEEEDGGSFAIWVRDENQVEKARDALKQFRVDPDAPQYRSAQKKAEAIGRDKARQAAAARKNMVNIRGKWGRGMPGGGPRKQPLTLFLIGVCVALFLLQNMNAGDFYRHLEFADSAHFRNTIVEDADGNRFLKPALTDTTSNRLVDIKRGQVWRLITPVFLHFGFLHIFFNCYMLFYLGGQVENRFGTLWYGLLLLAMGLFSVLVQCLMPEKPFGLPLPGGSPLGGGMSGVVFGVFGFIWVKMNTQPNAGLMMSPLLVIIMFGQFFLGITGMLDGVMGKNIAHWAHGAGLLAGIVIAAVHNQLRGR